MYIMLVKDDLPAIRRIADSSCTAYSTYFSKGTRRSRSLKVASTACSGRDLAFLAPAHAAFTPSFSACCSSCYRFLRPTCRTKCEYQKKCGAGGGARHHHHGCGQRALQEELNALVAKWLDEVPYGDPARPRLNAFSRLHCRQSSFHS